MKENELIILRYHLSQVLRGLGAVERSETGLLSRRDRERLKELEKAMKDLRERLIREEGG
jgi:hypothetical protein